MGAKARLAIIGGGIIGSATAMCAARAGLEVSVFDQYDRLHNEGGSHGATRAFRLAYFERSDYVPLLRRALSCWRSESARAPASFFEETGILEVGPPEGKLIAGVRAAAAEHAIEIENLSRREMRERFPWFALHDTYEGVVESAAGFVHAERATAWFQSEAMRASASFNWREPVIGLESTSAGLKLRTQARTLEADRLVMAPGAFAEPVFANLGLKTPCPIRPKEKALLWARPKSAHCRAGDGFPPFAIEMPDGDIFYGFPAIDNDGVKIGRHSGGDMLRAAAERIYANPEEAAAIRDFRDSVFPDLFEADSREAACLYAMSPDEDFVIDRSQEDPRISFAIGLSGHGFKFAPVIGEILTAFSTDRTYPLPVEFLTAKRF